MIDPNITGAVVGFAFAALSAAFVTACIRINALKHTLAQNFVEHQAEVTILENTVKSERSLHEAAENLAHKAIDAQAAAELRMNEVQKIHQELLSRPFNIMVPPNFVTDVGNAIVQYLDGHGGGGNGSMDAKIIFPKDKKPIP